MSEKIMFAHPQSTSLLALSNRSIHIYLRKYVWNGQKGRHQIYILSETLLVKPKLHTTTGKGYHTGHFGQVNKKSSRSWEQKTLIFNSNYWQKISKVWHVQDTRRTSRHLPDIDQSFSNNASHRGNNSQIRAGLVCETLHYLHQIPFSLHCRHNRHCRATYVAAWPTVQHEKQYKSSQNDLHLCLFACGPNF